MKENNSANKNFDITNKKFKIEVTSSFNQLYCESLKSSQINWLENYTYEQHNSPQNLNITIYNLDENQHKSNIVFNCNMVVIKKNNFDTEGLFENQPKDIEDTVRILFGTKQIINYYFMNVDDNIPNIYKQDFKKLCIGVITKLYSDSRYIKTDAIIEIINQLDYLIHTTCNLRLYATLIDLTPNKYEISLLENKKELQEFKEGLIKIGYENVPEQLNYTPSERKEIENRTGFKIYNVIEFLNSNTTPGKNECYVINYMERDLEQIKNKQRYDIKLIKIEV